MRGVAAEKRNSGEGDEHGEQGIQRWEIPILLNGRYNLLSVLEILGGSSEFSSPPKYAGLLACIV